MKCPECKGARKIDAWAPRVGGYSETCPTCHGSGQQPSVDKIQRIKEILKDNVFLQGENDESQDWALNAAVEQLESLESELSAARGEIERLKKLCKKQDQLLELEGLGVEEEK